MKIELPDEDAEIEPAPRIEHDKALARETAVLKDDTELFKQFSDNESFKRWLTGHRVRAYLTSDR